MSGHDPFFAQMTVSSFPFGTATDANEWPIGILGPIWNKA